MCIRDRIYPHARSYPAKLRLFAELIRSRMPNLVGLRAAGAEGAQPGSRH